MNHRPMEHIMGVSENSGTPKSSNLIGFFALFSPSILGYIPLFLETPISSNGPFSSQLC